jgi:hypothetical protein
MVGFCLVISVTGPSGPNKGKFGGGDDVKGKGKGKLSLN